METKAAAHQADQLHQLLRSSEDYRGFLRVYLHERDISLSDFARAAGFGRGFPGDILSQKRRLTIKSAPAFEKALKLPSAGKKFFRQLVAIEEPDIYPDLDGDQCREWIARSRKIAWRKDMRKATEVEAPSIAELLKNSHAMSVYAAAGDPVNGASREQIEQRTRLYGKELNRAITELLKTKLVEVRESQIFPRDLHLFFQTMDQSAILATIFKCAAQEASKRVATASSTHEFFFSSRICVLRESLPVLKKELRETTLRFVDQCVAKEGDAIAQLLVGFYA